MIRFFRVNDPYRLVILFFALLLLKLPFFIWPQMQQAELNWLVLAEKMNEVAGLYTGVWEETGPFSAIIYAFLFKIFGKTQITFLVLGSLLVVVQAGIFNITLIGNKAYHENTYIPALIYVVLSLSFFDLGTLSPQLMSMTFVLLALRSVFQRLDQKLEDQSFLSIGWHMALASLFYLPAIFYTFLALFALLLFTRTIPRRYLLLLYGFMMPYLVVLGYFWWIGELHLLYVNFFDALFAISDRNYLDFWAFLWIMLIPALFFVMAVFKTFQTPQFNNHQSRIQQIMFFFLLVSLLVWAGGNKKAPYQLIVFAAPFSFFLAHYFLIGRRKLLKEVFFFCLFAYCIWSSWGAWFQSHPIESRIQSEKLIVIAHPLENEIRGKRILQLGDELDFSPYRHAKLATPYLNYRLSEDLLEAPDYYDNLILIHRHFTSDVPEVIIDKKNIMEGVFDRIPLLKEKYRKEGEVYYLISK